MRRLILIFLFSLATIAMGEDADYFRDKGLAALRAAQSNPAALTTAARALVIASELYEKTGKDSEAQAINSYLYWCKKRMNLEQMETFVRESGEDAAKLVKKLEEIATLKPPVEDAASYFQRAEAFARASPSDHLLIAIRFYEVADRFKGTDLSLKAQDRSLHEMQQINLAQSAPQNVDKRSAAAHPKASEPAVRTAVPADLAQAEVEKTIAYVFKEDFDHWSPKDKMALAKKFMQQAADSKDDPASRFVLLREAARLSAQAGDLDFSFMALDQMAAAFVVDVKPFKQNALVAAARATLEPQMHNVIGALRTLLEKPDDPAANLLAGQYFCYKIGSWERGLACLAKSSDAGLKALAAKELPGPTAPLEQLSLADDWWEVSEKETVKDQKWMLQNRARYWYEKALPSLSGLNRAKAEKRVLSAILQKPWQKEVLPEALRASLIRSQNKLLFIVRDFMTWTEAEKWCRDRGATIFCIANEKENDFFAKLAPGRILRRAEKKGEADEVERLPMLAGGRKKDGKWVWADGSEWSFERWARGEPASGHGEDYLFVQPGGWWYAADRTAKAAFVAQWLAQ